MSLRALICSHHGPTTIQSNARGISIFAKPVVCVVFPALLLAALTQLGCTGLTRAGGSASPTGLAPSIITQPASQVVTVGQPATFSVVCTGKAPLSYRWWKNGTAISDATSASYTIPATITGDTATQFTVVVSNSAGSVTSSAATLTVKGTSTQLTASQSSLKFGNVNIGSNITLAVTLASSGNSNVTISSVSVLGPDFDASGVSAGLILSPGQTATLNVAFTPAASGNLIGNVTVASNATNSPAVISLSGVGVAPSNSAFASWVESSLIRVRPTDAPGTASSISLSGARGETVDTQVIVRAPTGGLTNVNMNASALTGPGGATISPSAFVFYREYYVTVVGSTPAGGTNPPLGSGTFPEPLIPFVDPETGAALSGSLQAVPVTVGANQNQPFWVDLNIPRGASNYPPGAYTGTVTVTSSQGNATVPVTLTLWNFELPLTPSEKSLFLIWSSSSQAYQQSLLRNKIMPWQVSSSEAKSDVPTFGLNRAGLDGTDYVGIQCDGSYTSIPSTSQISALTAQYPNALSLDFYAADEINGCSAAYAPIKQLAANAHHASPAAKVLITIPPDPNLYSDGTSDGLPAVDHWTMLAKDWPSSLSGIPGDFWSYASCNVGNGNPPGWMIDYPPIDERIQAGFLNITQGATGLLYWRVDNWPSGNDIGSWNSLPTSGCGVSRPGDGVMIYPPAPIGSTEPAPGMRLKALRDGIQDYEYVQILKNLGQGAFASSVIQPIATSWNDWTQDQNALEGARLQLGQELNRLSPP